MKRFMNKKVAVIGLTAGLLLGGAGAAFAYWTNSGSGNGSALTGAPTGTVTVNQTSTITAMYPGDTQTLSGNFTNTGAGAVKVGSVTATIGTLPGGCVAGDFSIGGTAPVNAEIAVGSGVGSWTGLTITMNDTALNQDSCQLSTIPIVYSVSAAS
jgi:hypothetical protein